MAARSDRGRPRSVRPLLPGAGTLPPGLTTVREARVGDAPAIAEIHVRSWQAAYRGLLPDDFLASLSVDERRARWQSALERPGEHERTFVAEERGSIVGFASAGPSRDEGEPEATGELYAIYLDPGWWGTGAGRLLIAAARAALLEAAFREATLWVLDANERAARFYQADGWRLDGGRRAFELGGVAAAVVRYRRSLE